MPKAKQLTVWVQDHPGALGEVASAVGAKKVNILAFTAWVEGERGAIRMVFDKTAVAKRALAARGWETMEEEVLELTLPNTPGSLGRVAKKLGDAGVNIRYAYTGLAETARRANIYFGVSDLKAAMKAVR
jgi:hypothetical protein